MAEEPPSSSDIVKVRSYFDARTNEAVTDEQIVAALDYFGRDSHRHMFAARAIVRSRTAVPDRSDDDQPRPLIPDSPQVSRTRGTP